MDMSSNSRASLISTKQGRTPGFQCTSKSHLWRTLFPRKVLFLRVQTADAHRVIRHSPSHLLSVCAYYLHDDLSIALTCLSVGGTMASVRTFDLKITQKSGAEHTFTSIARAEHEGIETFLKAKKVHVTNDMMDGNMIMTVPLNTDQDQTDSRPNQTQKSCGR